MFAQFRAQYPMGSLLSELLNIHEGKYIVRASIQVGGSTLATGLSAATTIEQAEDQARVRALVVLGIESRPYPTHLGNAELDEFTERSRPQLSVPTPQPEFLSLAKTAFQGALEVDWNTSTQVPLSFQSSEPQPPSWLDSDHTPETPISISRRAGADRVAGSERLSSRAAPARATPSRRQAASQPEQEELNIAAPIDLSDIIAQTDVELKRLDWTNAQGRHYLEQTYHKRSRQHLTDTELIEFLEYLKAQPTHANPAV
jgi:hypothetical protein